MGISPWQVAQLLPLWTPTLTKDDGTALNLTGATLTSVLHNVETGQDTAMIGAWVITNAALGQAQYTWASADVAIAGNYVIVVTATYAGGALPTDPTPFLLLQY
jgi:hypothetical protein